MSRATVPPTSGSTPVSMVSAGLESIEATLILARLLELQATVNGQTNSVQPVDWPLIPRWSILVSEPMSSGERAAVTSIGKKFLLAVRQR